jgi:hypothetical protein
MDMKTAELINKITRQNSIVSNGGNFSKVFASGHFKVPHVTGTPSPNSHWPYTNYACELSVRHAVIVEVCL